MEDERGDVKRLKYIGTGFRITYLRESDTALYKCLSNSNETYTVDLQVEIEPYFITENELKPFIISRHHSSFVEFDCASKGNPKPKVSTVVLRLII